MSSPMSNSPMPQPSRAGAGLSRPDSDREVGRLNPEVQLRAIAIDGDGRGYVNDMSDFQGTLRLAGDFYGLEVNGEVLFRDGNARPPRRLEVTIQNQIAGSVDGFLSPFDTVRLPGGEGQALSITDSSPETSVSRRLLELAQALESEQGADTSELVAFAKTVAEREQRSASTESSDSRAVGKWRVTPLKKVKQGTNFDGVIQTASGNFDLVGGINGAFISPHGTDNVKPLAKDKFPLRYPMSMVVHDGVPYVSGRYSAYVQNGHSAIYRMNQEGGWEQIGKNFKSDRLRLAVADVDGQQLLFARSDVDFRDYDDNGLFVLVNSESNSDKKNANKKSSKGASRKRTIVKAKEDALDTKTLGWKRVKAIDPSLVGRRIISIGDLLVLSGSTKRDSQLTVYDPAKKKAFPLRDLAADLVAHDDSRSGQLWKTLRALHGMGTQPTRSLGRVGECLVVGFPAVPSEGGRVIAGAIWDREKFIPIEFPSDVNTVTAWHAVGNKLYAAAGIGHDKDDAYVSGEGELVPMRFRIHEISLPH